MPTSSDLWDVFHDGLEGLKNTIWDAQDKGVDATTLSNVVELATLRAFSLLEDFLQQLFYLCMLDDVSVSGTGSIVAVTSNEEVELLLLAAGGRREKYLSWLPFDRTLDLAEIYLREGHPFAWLKYRQTELRSLSELTIVRNAVAHPSSHAKQAFEKLASSKGYPSLRPADYLLSKRSGTEEVLLSLTRIEKIGQALVSDSEHAADALLEPESPFQPRAKAPAGTFACIRCGEEVDRVAPGALGACPICEQQEPCPQCGKVPAASTTWRRVIAAAD